MSDKALENAIAKREALAASINQAQQQVDGWRKELVKVDEFITAWHAFAGPTLQSAVRQGASSVTAAGSLSASAILLGASATGQVGDLAGADVKPKRPRHNSRKEDVAEAARAIIQERGLPVGRSELFKAIREKGLVIDGSDPEMVLSTMLWRMRNRIVRVKGGGYWLAEVPNAEVGYDPETASQDDTKRHTPLGEVGRLSADDVALLRKDDPDVDSDPSPDIQDLI